MTGEASLQPEKPVFVRVGEAFRELLTDPENPTTLLDSASFRTAEAIYVARYTFMPQGEYRRFGQRLFSLEVTSPDAEKTVYFRLNEKNIQRSLAINGRFTRQERDWVTLEEQLAAAKGGELVQETI